MKAKPLIAALMIAGISTPALADGDVLTVTAPRQAKLPEGKVPRLLTQAEYASYRAIFASMRAGDWSAAAARLDAMPAGLLQPIVRAELYLAQGAPRVEPERLVALIREAPDLPQAIQLARLARENGVVDLPALPVLRDLVRIPGAPKRIPARPTRSDIAAAMIGAQILPLIKADRPGDAEALLESNEGKLSPDALTEWRQRIAWSYYLTGDDVSSRRLAEAARRGSGEWTVQADWVAGLAAWRARDCAAAADAFGSVASRARDSEMIAAGLFWAARSDLACGRPQFVQGRLRSASRLEETFYGLIAAAMLGTGSAPENKPDFIQADWTTVSKLPSARIAAALIEIGERGLADELLRHQARIGPAHDHEALLHLAAKLDLPATQIWLAQNGPAGMRMSAAARYPAPAWAPQGGWRVDRSLIYAHALQESQFRPDAVSPAGARGLMQIMPGTAQYVARHRGETIDQVRLIDPALNMEYGQSYLQELADNVGTGGLLPKVIAAYNAGPGAVAAWNARGRNLSDPLLFIESIPFVETRAYVAIVLRNYWMYERQEGVASESLAAMAQGMWPRFPGLPGRSALRLDSLGQTASAD